MKFLGYRTELIKVNKKNQLFLYSITLLLFLLSVFLTFFIKWRIYIKSIPEQKIYFQDSFDNKNLQWKTFDGEWKGSANGAKGIVQISRKNYATPYLMTILPISQSPNEDFVFHVKIKPVSFTNDSVVAASLILPTDPISIVINRQGQVGIARNLFEKPVYGSAKFDFKDNEWHDLYMNVNDTKKKISVYVDSTHVLDKDLVGETYPVQEIWLGALWLNGGGNYGAPIDISYDSISIGNIGTMPVLSFKDYIISLFHKNKSIYIGR